MIPPLDALRLTGARILRDGLLETGDIAVEHGMLSDGASGPDLDLRGYWILPGIVDLHGDAFEHHMAPRPTAPFPLAMGLAGTDRDAASHGVTTAYLAQSWSWEGADRSPDFAEDLMDAHQSYRAEMLTDLRLQIRCETHTVDTYDRLIAALRRHKIDYVIFNNHLDQILEAARKTPGRVAGWADQAGRTIDEHLAVIHTAQQQTPDVPRHLRALAAEFTALGIRFGSHDDPDAETRTQFARIGATICEFPTHRSAAQAAKAQGGPILMGAPNVVRGGSQSGGVAAADLIAEDLCDALVSDYHYPTLAQAAFQLAQEGLMPLPRAWEMISTRPARIAGLTDRGRIAPGLRADLTIVNAASRRIEATMAGGRWSYMAAGAAHRLSRTATGLSAAAE